MRSAEWGVGSRVRSPHREQKGEALSLKTSNIQHSTSNIEVHNPTSRNIQHPTFNTEVFLLPRHPSLHIQRLTSKNREPERGTGMSHEPAGKNACAILFRDFQEAGRVFYCLHKSAIVFEKTAEMYQEHRKIRELFAKILSVHPCNYCSEKSSSILF
jgi:hypothetical protein